MKKRDFRQVITLICNNKETGVKAETKILFLIINNLRN